jgi:hypothetical protein
MQLVFAFAQLIELFPRCDLPLLQLVLALEQPNMQPWTLRSFSPPDGIDMAQR